MDIFDRLKTLETVGISTPILYAFINHHQILLIGNTALQPKKFAIVTYL